MKDINEIMPKIDNMKWGALTNRPPTKERITEMDRIFPDNGKWHTIFEHNDLISIDGKHIRKKSPDRWT